MAKKASSQGEKMVNIPRSVEDEFYRYKMPQLRAKVEGRGNGIKTVIENMVEIAKALDRRPDYPTKFFGFELGSLTNTHTDKYIVNGKHTAETLSKILDTFIEKYILCGSCKNPETDTIIKGENIGLVCRACGSSTQVDPVHKLSTYILKYPPTSERTKPQASKTIKEKRKLAKKDPKEKKEVSKTASDDEDDEDWSIDTSKEAVEARRREILGANERLSAGSTAAIPEERTPELNTNGNTAAEFVLEVAPGANPIPVLQKFWETDPTPEVIVSKVKQLQSVQGYNETVLLRTIFASLFDKNIRQRFYKKAETLQLFVPSQKEQKMVLMCIEKLAEIEPSTVDHMAHILNGFYEENVLDEAILKKWFKNPSDKFDAKLSKKIREVAKPFIEWLENAEEEESDDDGL
eukprot:TRINITY_DN1417_c0_g1_i1.p1 TRINITY_DN1417_c0_g1~~TRINITY_DN1417_c0_g1_i1.p1  ORF type:complete len:414 (-),score=143.34 TRINITY_DN1417_c0_g1_i1:109-1326(-)